MVVEEELGEGCFGEVHKGIVKGPIPNSRTMKHSICVTVALKFLKSKSVSVVVLIGHSVLHIFCGRVLALRSHMQ